MGYYEVVTIVKQSLDDMDIHLVAVPAYRPAAFDIPMTVYEILGKTAVDFAAGHDIAKIDVSGV